MLDEPIDDDTPLDVQLVTVVAELVVSVGLLALLLLFLLVRAERIISRLDTRLCELDVQSYQSA